MIAPISHSGTFIQSAALVNHAVALSHHRLIAETATFAVRGTPVALLALENRHIGELSREIVRALGVKAARDRRVGMTRHAMKHIRQRRKKDGTLATLGDSFKGVDEAFADLRYEYRPSRRTKRSITEGVFREFLLIGYSVTAGGYLCLALRWYESGARPWKRSIPDGYAWCIASAYPPDESKVSAQAWAAGELVSLSADIGPP